MIGAPDKGARFDVPESHLQSDFLQFSEFLRMHEPVNRQVFFRRLQVLAEREDDAILPAQVLEHTDDLVNSFANSQHQSRFRDESSPPGPIEQREGPLVFGLGPDDGVQPRHRLHIVIQNVGQRIQNDVQRKFFAPEIRDQYLDPDPRVRRAHLTDRLRKYLGPSVVKLVSIHRCNHRMAQAQKADRPGDAGGFVGIKFRRLSRLDRAEAATSRADIAEDHKRSRAVVPAFTRVGAAGFLAYGMKAVAVDDRLQAGIILPARNPGLEPFGPLSARRLGRPPHFLNQEIHTTWLSSKFSRSFTTVSRNEPPSAPSTIRWSNPSVKYPIDRTAIPSLITTARFSMEPVPKIATC